MVVQHPVFGHWLEFQRRVLDFMQEGQIFKHFGQETSQDVRLWFSFESSGTLFWQFVGNSFIHRLPLNQIHRCFRGTKTEEFQEASKDLEVLGDENQFLTLIPSHLTEPPLCLKAESAEVVQMWMVGIHSEVSHVRVGPVTVQDVASCPNPRNHVEWLNRQLTTLQARMDRISRDLKNSTDSLHVNALKHELVDLNVRKDQYQAELIRFTEAKVDVVDLSATEDPSLNATQAKSSSTEVPVKDEVENFEDLTNVAAKQKKSKNPFKRMQRRWTSRTRHKKAHLELEQEVNQLRQQLTQRNNTHQPLANNEVNDNTRQILAQKGQEVASLQQSLAHSEQRHQNALSRLRQVQEEFDRDSAAFQANKAHLEAQLAMLEAKLSSLQPKLNTNPVIERELEKLRHIVGEQERREREAKERERRSRERESLEEQKKRFDLMEAQRLKEEKIWAEKEIERLQLEQDQQQKEIEEKEKIWLENEKNRLISLSLEQKAKDAKEVRDAARTSHIHQQVQEQNSFEETVKQQEAERQDRQAARKAQLQKEITERETRAAKRRARAEQERHEIERLRLQLEADREKRQLQEQRMLEEERERSRQRIRYEKERSQSRLRPTPLNLSPLRIEVAPTFSPLGDKPRSTSPRTSRILTVTGLSPTSRVISPSRGLSPSRSAGYSSGSAFTSPMGRAPNSAFSTTSPLSSGTPIFLRTTPRLGSPRNTMF